MSSPESEISPRPARRKSLWRRHRVGSLLVTMMLTAVLGAMLYLAMGRPVSAPDWLRAEIEARAADALGAASLRFDALDVVLGDGLTPQVRMSNVQLVTDAGLEIVAFAELRARLSLENALQGLMRPEYISVSGVFATLRRQADGSFTLSGGLDLSSPRRQAATLPQLIEEVDAVLSSPALAALAVADVQSLTLRIEDMRTGQAWTVDGGRMHLNREDETLRITSDLALLSGGQGVATLEANYESRVGETAATFGATVTDVAAGDIAALSAPFAWLDVLRAPISGAVRGGVEADGTLAPLNATLAIGAGVIQPTDAARPVPFNAARSYFTYKPEARLLRFDELSVDSDWITAEISGETVLGINENRQLVDLVGQFTSSVFRANPDGLYPQPADVDGLDMDFRLALDPFRLDVGEALFEYRGQLLRARGALEATEEGWQYSVDGHLDGLTPDRLFALWPERLAIKARKWMTDNLLGGSLSDLNFAVRGQNQGLPVHYASFEFQQAHVRYVKTLPPVSGAHGTASLLNQRFAVTIDKGQIEAPLGGLLDVAGTSFIIPQITPGEGTPAVVRVEAEGTITAALALLDLPPLNLMSKADLSPDLADGQLSVSGTLALPLRKGLKPTEVQYNATGMARDVLSTTLIKGRALASDALRVVARDTGVDVSGPGTLDGVPFDVTWQQPIGNGPQPSTLKGTIELSERTIDAFGLGLPAGTVTGQGVGDIAITLPVGGAAPSFELNTTLRGIRLSVPPLGWSKPADADAALSLTGLLGDAPRVDSLRLDAPGLRANGSITLIPGGGLERAQIDRVELGQWLDAPVDLIGRGANIPPEINVRGGTLDLRNADFGGAASGSAAGRDGGPLTLTLDQLQVTDTIRLTGVQGQFDLAGGLDGEFTAQINGGAAIRGQVLPQNGRSAIRITSDDAGGVAGSAGLLKQARGGALSLTLLPVGAASFDGTLNVSETRIKDAPAIAALLNAISVVGLLEQMGGSGIHFQEVEAAFRLTPSTMVLTQASAVGPSMGLSMFGSFDVANGVLDMQGVISPLFILNGIGSFLTRKGEGLIGFNYSLSGPASNPSVQVNPLSALAPGMFRDVFRRAAPELPRVEGDDTPPDNPEAFATEEPEETLAERRMRERNEARDNR
jgi:hypothetical protein